MQDKVPIKIIDKSFLSGQKVKFSLTSLCVSHSYGSLVSCTLIDIRTTDTNASHNTMTTCTIRMESPIVSSGIEDDVAFCHTSTIRIGRPLVPLGWKVLSCLVVLIQLDGKFYRV